MSLAPSSLIGRGAPDLSLTPDDVRVLLAQAFDPLALDGRRVLVVIPDGTRSAPIPLLFTLLAGAVGTRVTALDYLIALGTHPPMSEEAIERLVGVSAAERAQR
ncbi:MAG TPA: lactate racemase domain-containing protein, partial [Ktedonobacterales bacterium]|nr:lactate racemase domain-containing protein [Ktedonobacterales bacterium]